MIDTNQKIIDKNIIEIAKVAYKLPGVVVLHDLRDWSVAWMSPRGLEELGVTLEEITSLASGEYYYRYFNPEDAKDYAPKILSLMERNIADEICTCFQQVRFGINAPWKWHMASTMVFARDESGKPLLAITIAFPIDTMHHMTFKAERLLEENNFLRNNIQLFSSLSKRECEILKLLAMGASSIETAEKLFISIGTVDTHRKNIKKKLNTNSYFELCQFARAFNLI
ncbi:helix-turn-helix transcriptional regulator [Arcicella sp. DC2W]|uniref:Helix-turn-helix transcriptional regulator n=1 Tax=Arcicella gelida TaxID=2984195 RepID=A0ABU5S6B9_9BACT|nr:helix-turn-helix transcriptional regulator [Arcicella sp. DC2W]MEA5404023.1 helix-turn-helix transcriptional regulator [Arcicella sp. DC2W]